MNGTCCRGGRWRRWLEQDRLWLPARGQSHEMANPGRFAFMIEDLFDVIEPTQRIEIFEQQPWPAKGEVNTIPFKFILRLGDPLRYGFKIRRFFAVGGINFVGRVETSREDRVRSIGHGMRRHSAIASIHFHAIRHAPPMDLQIAIIRCRSWLPTCDLEISILHSPIELLHRSWWIRKTPPWIAPFSIIEKSPHPQRMGCCIKQTDDWYRGRLQGNVWYRFAREFLEVRGKRKRSQSLMSRKLYAKVFKKRRPTFDRW